MKRVIIESPYGSKDEIIVIRNQIYLGRCIMDSLSRGEAPFASHGFYTQYLDDNIPEERKLGIEAGFAWGKVTERVAVYHDYGITEGMRQGINQYLHKIFIAIEKELWITYRLIGKD